MTSSSPGLASKASHRAVRRCSPKTGIVALTVWLCAACTVPGAPENPESPSGYQAKPGWTFNREAVAAANPLAAEAGAEVLRRGGSAVDAAVAVQLVLGVVEPQASGVGGGAFMLLHDGPALLAYDGRETAPAAADEQLLMGANGKPLPFEAAAIGGRAVGVPGVMRLLEMAHQRHGRLPWAALFEPALALAERGFAVSPRLHAALSADRHLKLDAEAARLYYLPDGQPLPVGHRLRNPALAATLRLLAQQGAQALHQGPLAQAVVARVQGHAINPGRLSLADLAAYQAKPRAALCWRQAAPAWGRTVRVCGFPPPSSGALAVGQISQLMAQPPAARPDDTHRDGAASATASAWLPDDTLHRYVEASRLAFADRAHYVGDPDYVSPPPGGWAALLDPAYLHLRARLIGPRRAAEPPAGVPGPQASALGPVAVREAQPEFGTSHFSIVDSRGQALAMTTSIEQAFGSRLMVGGFLLNNQLTDFAFAPRDAQGRPVANRVQPGKRPRSSMAPTLVFDDATGELLMSTGGAGGAHIIHHTAQLLLATLHQGRSVQEAVSLPRVGLAFDGSVMLEDRGWPAAAAESLRQRGHPVRLTPLTSGQQAIERAGPAWRVGADPRREGLGAGQ